MFGRGRLSPVRARTILTLNVEAIATTFSRVIQPVIAMTVLSMPTFTMVSGSLYLCRPEPCVLEL